MLRAAMRYQLSRPIVVVDYRPEWAVRFEEERARLLALLGDAVVAIEHFGSTAVPGLPAKPLIDLLAGVRVVEDVIPAVAAALAGAGYRDCGRQAPGRWLFSKGGPYNEGTHHLHLVEHGSEAWTAPLAFRDHLRARPAVARRYARLKRAAAARYGTDIDGYAAAKTAFVQAVLAAAHGRRARPPCPPAVPDRT